MPQAGVLHVIGGHDRGKRFELTLPETHIGRGADQNVVLSDIAVSRRHVTVLFEGGRYRVRDLGSGNGTLVNGQRVDLHVLVDGDHIEIGQTVMRFEHAASRAGAQAPAPAPTAKPAPPPAPVESAPFGMPASALPTETPSDASVAPPVVANAVAATAGQRLRLPFDFKLDTPKKRAMVFGGMGLVSLICLVVIFSRTVLAKPQVVPSEAEELYKQGLRLFGAGDYEGAKISFGEAVTQAPDAPDAKRYLHQCDVEIKAKSALQAAERNLTAHKYLDALKSLREIDATAVESEQAARLRRENVPRAVDEVLEEANRLASTQPEEAQAKLEHALELDLGDEQAAALKGRLTLLRLIALGKKENEPVAPPVEPPAPPEKPEKPEKNDKRRRGKAGRDADAELAPVKAGRPKEKETASATALPSNAMTAYKNKDFSGAEKAFRLQAAQDSGKSGQKWLDLANQVRQLKTAVDRAATEEGTKPDLAIRDYQEALSIDARVGRGTHAAWLKSKIGKLDLGYAQQAFGQGKYDVAYAAAKDAQRGGVDAGALLKQLDLKAADLVQKGQAMQKANVGQAKQYWRMVLKMVAPGTASYTKAYQLLNNAAGSHRDEDED
jgi:hypothetical protein